MAGYLHLFYEDWEFRNPNPAQIINSKKEEIKKKAVDKLKITASGSMTVEKEFEKLYALNGTQFKDAGIIETLDVANKEMSSFDQAIADLKTLIGQQGTLTQGIELCNTCIASIDNILNMGAQTHGLTDSAYQEVKNFKQKLMSVKSSLRHTALNKRTAAERNELLDTIKAVQSNISGYLMEIAFVYAFLKANKECLGKMINIGGHGSNFGEYWKKDPRMLDDFQKINEALATNESQSKADAVFRLCPDIVSATTSWTGFQIKNFSDISSIHVGNYTLKEVFDEAGYHDMFLVNIAGTLAGDQYGARKIIPSSLRTHDKNKTTQGAVDNLWIYLKNSTKPLAIADALAGAAAANFTNKINYYVIRNKNGNGGAGTINVIPVSKILLMITDMLETNVDNIFGINIGQYNGIIKAADRSDYWQINVDAFDEDDSTGQTRSQNAYSAMLAKVQATKISISVNFSQVLSALT